MILSCKKVIRYFVTHNVSMSIFFMYGKLIILVIIKQKGYQIPVTLNDSMSILKCCMSMFSVHHGTKVISKLSFLIMKEQQ